MKKEIFAITLATTATIPALAWHHHGYWGRGGCHFWPGFAGGVVGGLIGGWGWNRTVVVPAYTTYPAYTTPVVIQQQQPVVVQQPAPVKAQQAVQTVSMPANNTVVSTKDVGTTVYVDTNGNQRIVGELLIDGKGNKMLPANYQVIRVNDLTRE